MRLRAIGRRLFWGGTGAERRFGFALLLVALGLGLFVKLAGGEWRDAVADRKAMVAERMEASGRAFDTPEDRERAIRKSVRVEHWVRSGLYWAAVANLALASVLFLTRRWWCGREVKPRAAKAAPRLGRLWLWVGVAVLLGLVLRWPRVDLSLYNDEVYNFRQYIHGKVKTGRDGSERFERAGWMETLWENRANNGVLFSALARLSDDAWRPGDGTSDGQINERALRWPALLPGLLSIAAIALLGRELFGGAAGLAAAFLFALHPWHLRYSTEARAYGLVILFAVLAMFCLVRALRGNRWRWWLGFGGCQFLYMYAFAGALYFALGINVAALFAIAARGRGWRRAAMGRLVVASLLSAMLYLQLMAPCLPQMAAAMDELESLRGEVTMGRAADVVSYLALGMPMSDGDPGNAHNPALAKFWPSGWWLLLPALAAVGLWAFFAALVFARRGLPRVLLAGNALAFALAFGVSAIAGSTLHYWYVIYLLPFVTLFLAAGWAVVWKSRRLRPLAYALPLLVALVVWRPLRDYRGHSKQDLRGAVEIARAGGAMVAGFWSDSSAYDLDMRIVRRADDLHEFAEEARAAGRDLAVVFGHRDLAMGTMAECVEIVEGGGDLAFQKIAELPGLEEAQFTTYVYRLAAVR